MKKKKILLLTSIASIATFSAAAIMFSSHSKTITDAGDNYIPYIVEFRHAQCTPHEEKDDVIPFTLYQTMGDHNEYYVQSDDSMTNAYSIDLDNISFTNPNCILEISASYYDSITIQFKFFDRVSLNFDKSVVNVYFDEINEDNYYADNKFTDFGDINGYRTCYYFLQTYDISVSYSKIILESIHLEFTCKQ